MKILFTKTGIENEVSEQLGAGFDCHFRDFIVILHLNVETFPLTHQSLIFTSSNAVKAFFENGFQLNEQKIYAVGQKTKAALHEFGFFATEVFRNVADLADYLLTEKPEEELLHFCGNLTLDILENVLKDEGLSYQKIMVYHTQLLYPEISENYDAVVFFSPSGVRSFAKLNSLEGKTLFSIGKTTEKELKKFTPNPIFTSTENSLEDLLQIIKQ